MTQLQRVALLSLVFLAGFLRFFHLMHDRPYFFNPDERNMANSIIQMRLPYDLKSSLFCIASPYLARFSSPASCALHPHFFAYGQFPLYLSFFSHQAFARITSPSYLREYVPFLPPVTDSSYSVSDTVFLTPLDSAIFFLRFWSAVSSTLTVLLVFGITRHLLTPYLSLRRSFPLSFSAGLLTAFLPNLIQSAHFGTTESLLAFFFCASVFFSLRMFSDDGRVRFSSLFFSGVACGLSLGTKLTGAFFLLPPLLSFFLFLPASLSSRIFRSGRVLLSFFSALSFFLTTTLVSGTLSSPYTLLDFSGFRASVFGYEKDVATGAYQAFYTRQFAGTLPLVFQATHVFPPALGVPVFLLGTAGFFFLFFLLFFPFGVLILRFLGRQVRTLRFPGIRRPLLPSPLPSFSPDQPLLFLPAPRPTVLFSRFFSDWNFLLLLLPFLALLLPTSFLYAKWTRFMTPVLPFFPIFFLTAFGRLFLWFSSWNRVFSLLLFSLSISSILPGVAFLAIYLRADVRVTASRWIYDHIPDGSFILFETANVVDIPLGISGYEGTLPTYSSLSFDFYHVDENPELFDRLIDGLEQADYFFIPSRRVFLNHLRFPTRYPVLSSFYTALFSGDLGFEQVVTFSSYPQLGVWQIADEHVEETTTVFDHPVIRIYKKVRQLEKSAYEALLSGQSANHLL